ncbi:MAG TPA: hypothetical protein VJJ83_03720, partial [Candidatus Babeliales bacterium]|nr:hypothetical protein [Candidatus Babeliales bacterium]
DLVAELQRTTTPEIMASFKIEAPTTKCCWRTKKRAATHQYRKPAPTELKALVHRANTNPSTEIFTKLALKGLITQQDFFQIITIRRETGMATLPIDAAASTETRLHVLDSSEILQDL